MAVSEFDFATYLAWREVPARRHRRAAMASRSPNAGLVLTINNNGRIERRDGASAPAWLLPWNVSPGRACSRASSSRRTRAGHRADKVTVATDRGSGMHTCPRWAGTGWPGTVFDSPTNSRIGWPLARRRGGRAPGITPFDEQWFSDDWSTPSEPHHKHMYSFTSRRQRSLSRNVFEGPNTPSWLLAGRYRPRTSHGLLRRVVLVLDQVPGHAPARLEVVLAERAADVRGLAADSLLTSSCRIGHHEPGSCSRGRTCRRRPSPAPRSTSCRPPRPPVGAIISIIFVWASRASSVGPSGGTSGGSGRGGASGSRGSPRGPGRP